MYRSIEPKVVRGRCLVPRENLASQNIVRAADKNNNLVRQVRLEPGGTALCKSDKDFELGLIPGALGSDRTLALRPANREIELPSDT